MKKLIVCVLIFTMSVPAWAAKKDDCQPLDVYMRSAKIYMGAMQKIPDFPAAQRQLDKAMECYPDEGEPRYFTAKIYYRKRMYDKFLTIAKSMDSLELSPAYRDTVWQMRAAAFGELFKRGVDSLKASNAIDSLRLIAQESGDSDAFDSLTNEGRRMLESSKNLFLASMEMDTTRSEPFQNIAVICVRLQTFEEALTWFRAALDVKPEENNYIRNLMALNMRLERNDSALHYTRVLLEREPDDMEALTNMARLFVELDFPDSANQVFNEIIEKDPENKPVLFNLGMTQVKSAQDYGADVLRNQKSAQAAQKEYNRLANAGAKTSELKTWETKGSDAMKSATEAQSNADEAWAAASSLFERLAGLDKSDFEAHYFWGLSQFYLRNYETSLEPLEHAVATNPDYCAGWNMLYYSRLKAGKMDLAKEAKARYDGCTP